MMSISPFAMKIRSAFSGEADARCSSLNQLICSGVESGMKMDVKICRKAGFSFPQPWRMRAASACPWATASSSRFSQPRAYEP